MMIEKEARDQVQRLENIRLGRKKPQKYDGGCLRRVPHIYKNFVSDNPGLGLDE